VHSIEKKIKPKVLDDISQISHSIDSRKEREEREIGDLIENSKKNIIK
jgi:hypothetical protein